MINLKFYFRFLSIMLLVTAFLPIIHENLPTGLGSFRFFWAPLWLISLILLRFEVFTTKIIIYFFVYGLCLAFLFLLAWINIDNWLIKNISEEFYWMLITISLLFYYYFKDLEGLALISKISLIFIGITAILSIIASYMNPLYARLITSSSSGFIRSEEGIFFLKMGAGQYSFGQSLICLFPILIYFYKNKIKLYPGWAIMVYILILYFTIIRMQFFANIILGTLAILVSFTGSKHLKVSVTVICLTMIVALLAPKSTYFNFLSSISEFFEPSTENYNKIIDIADFVETGDKGSIANRFARYPMLYESFMKSPFLGNSASTIPDDIQDGYHLHWMGKLAATGIIGLLLFLWPQYHYLKFCFKHFDKNYTFYAAISFVIFFALGLMKTIAGRDIWFTYIFLIPAISFLSLDQTKLNPKDNVSRFDQRS